MDYFYEFPQLTNEKLKLGRYIDREMDNSEFFNWNGSAPKLINDNFDKNPTRKRKLSNHIGGSQDAKVLKNTEYGKCDKDLLEANEKKKDYQEKLDSHGKLLQLIFLSLA